MTDKIALAGSCYRKYYETCEPLTDEEVNAPVKVSAEIIDSLLPFGREMGLARRRLIDFHVAIQSAQFARKHLL